MDFYGVTIKATPWKVRDLAQLKRESKLHLPDLQRSFVWSSERVRALHDGSAAAVEARLGESWLSVHHSPLGHLSAQFRNG